jgi:hypothetical protein
MEGTYDVLEIRRLAVSPIMWIGSESLPPRVGLYLVIFRRYAWYFTIIETTSVHHSLF